MKLHQHKQTKSKDVIFANADALLEEAQAYFKFCDLRPWSRKELVKYKGDYSDADVEVGRPYTQQGLCVYLNVSLSYFRSRKALIREKTESGTATPADIELNEAIEYIETIIAAQQIEGATVGVFNANIVARINGMGDNAQGGATGSTIINITTRDQATTDNLHLLTTQL